jgi:hypothetical protein
MHHHRESPSHQHLAQHPLGDVPVLLFAVPLGILEDIPTRDTSILLLKVGMVTSTMTKINSVQPFNTMMMMTMTSRTIFSPLNKAYHYLIVLLQQLLLLLIETLLKLMQLMLILPVNIVKLLPLPQPPVRARTDARTNPSAQRATQLRSVLARVYAVSIQKQITTTVP